MHSCSKIRNNDTPKASKYFKIQYSKLHDKINKTHKNKSGGQNTLSDNLESYIVKA